MKTRNCISVLIAVVLLLVLSVPTTAGQAEAAGGSCGENVTWSLKKGKLTIEGTGPMEDYTEENPVPWLDYSGLGKNFLRVPLLLSGEEFTARVRETREPYFACLKTTQL